MGISVAEELEGECLSLLLQVGVVPGSRLEVVKEMAESKQSTVPFIIFFSHHVLSSLLTRQIEQSSENCRIHIGDYDYSESLYESQLAVLSALDSLWLRGDRELNLFGTTAPPPTSHHEQVTPFVSLSILSKPDALRCWVIA
ncbi:unnamed protein product [Linum tenue]|uniref:Uncharacterized protein n=1 Tax=Linum tenue TaxID=586396 RepID=A0AAV0PLK8_9ROSI|nr:unnamed protein product [Linum tenue]